MQLPIDNNKKHRFGMLNGPNLGCCRTRMQDFGRQAGQVLYSDVFFRHGRRWGKPCRDRLVVRCATVSPQTKSDFGGPACDGRLASSRRAEGVHSYF